MEIFHCEVRTINEASLQLKCIFPLPLTFIWLISGSSSIKVVDEQSGTVHLVGSHYISSACSLSTRSAIIMLLLTTMLYTLVY